MYTVLVVDDSTVTQRTVSAQLRKHGFTTIAAQTAGRAQAELAARPVDLIILDLGMPDSDGITVLHELRRNKFYQALPVIVLTASGQDTDRVEARGAGATAFLTKPASTWELLQAVDRALGIPGHPHQMTGPWDAGQVHSKGSL